MRLPIVLVRFLLTFFYKISHIVDGMCRRMLASKILFHYKLDMAFAAEIRSVCLPGKLLSQVILQHLAILCGQRGVDTVTRNDAGQKLVSE